MINKKFEGYNISIALFSEMFKSMEKGIMENLSRCDLDTDFEFKSKDTKKVLHITMLRAILADLKGRGTRHIIIVSQRGNLPPISGFSEFNKVKMERELLKMGRFLKKWFPSNILLTQFKIEKNDPTVEEFVESTLQMENRQIGLVDEQISNLVKQFLSDYRISTT